MNFSGIATWGGNQAKFTSALAVNGVCAYIKDQLNVPVHANCNRKQILIRFDIINSCLGDAVLISHNLLEILSFTVFYQVGAVDIGKKMCQMTLFHLQETRNWIKLHEMRS